MGKTESLLCILVAEVLIGSSVYGFFNLLDMGGQLSVLEIMGITLGLLLLAAIGILMSLVSWKECLRDD